MIEELKNIVYVGVSSFACNQGAVDKCPNRERTISYATFVTMPEEVINPETKYKECCYESLVLADNSGKLHRNDFSGFYYQKQLQNEVCDFVLVNKITNERHDLNNSTFGEFKPFLSIPNQPNLTTFIVHWDKVLEVIGEGVYQVIKDISITGISFSRLSRVFTLKTFSDYHADKTIRIDVAMNGLLEEQNVDFSNSGYKSSIRVGGFFGRREAKYEEDIIMFRSKKIEQITMKMTNSYKLQTELLPECMTTEILDFHLFADEIFINDYNLINHSYSYYNKSVVYENNEGTKYYTENRKARLNLTFKDRFANKNKLNY